VSLPFGHYATDQYDSDPEDDGLYHCGECHEASDGNRCDTCHAGICEGCGEAVLHGEIGDRVPDDPTLMWCKACAPTMHAELEAEYLGFVGDVVAESRR
jgi:hypothetical protein